MLVIITILTKNYFKITPTMKYKIIITHARDNKKINKNYFKITPPDVHNVPCPLFPPPTQHNCASQIPGLLLSLGYDRHAMTCTITVVL